MPALPPAAAPAESRWERLGGFCAAQPDRRPTVYQRLDLLRATDPAAAELVTDLTSPSARTAGVR